MSKLAKDTNRNAIQVLRPDVVEVESISGSAAAATAITAETRVVRLVSTVDCFYSVTGTATTSSNYLPANTIEYIHVYTGDVVSTITSGGTGSIFITSMV